MCSRMNKEIAAIKVKSASAAEVKRVVPRTLGIEGRGAAELEKLEAPTSLARAWAQMLAYRHTLAAELSQLLAIAKRNDGTSIKPLAAAKARTHAQLSKLAKQTGFKDCAKVGRVG
jgi:hypothetical protein